MEDIFFPYLSEISPSREITVASPEQIIVYDENNAAQVAAAGPPKTHLTSFFDTNARDPNARSILYPDFPKYFTWNLQNRKWVRRRRVRSASNEPGILSDTIGRLPVVSLTPHQTEIYFFRMLLYNNAGAVSFDDILKISMVNNVLHFKILASN